MTIPRGTNPYNPTARHQLLFGDETTFGLALSLQPVFKANMHCYHYCFELDEDNFDAPALLGLDNVTLFRKRDRPGRRSPLNNFNTSSTFHELPGFSSNHKIESEDWAAGNFILAGNATSVQIVRKQLKNKNVTGKISAKGYWMAGKTGL
jgi:hypothetical protein